MEMSDCIYSEDDLAVQHFQGFIQYWGKGGFSSQLQFPCPRMIPTFSIIGLQNRLRSDRKSICPFPSLKLSTISSKGRLLSSGPSSAVFSSLAQLPSDRQFHGLVFTIFIWPKEYSIVADPAGMTKKMSRSVKV